MGRGDDRDIPRTIYKASDWPLFLALLQRCLRRDTPTTTTEGDSDDHAHDDDDDEQTRLWIQRLLGLAAACVHLGDLVFEAPATEDPRSAGSLATRQASSSSSSGMKPSLSSKGLPRAQSLPTAASMAASALAGSTGVDLCTCTTPTALEAAAALLELSSHDLLQVLVTREVVIGKDRLTLAQPLAQCTAARDGLLRGLYSEAVTLLVQACNRHLLHSLPMAAEASIPAALCTVVDTRGFDPAPCSHSLEAFLVNLTADRLAVRGLDGLTAELRHAAVDLSGVSWEEDLRTVGAITRLLPALDDSAKVRRFCYVLIVCLFVALSLYLRCCCCGIDPPFGLGGLGAFVGKACPRTCQARLSRCK